MQVTGTTENRANMVDLVSENCTGVGGIERRLNRILGVVDGPRPGETDGAAPDSPGIMGQLNQTRSILVRVSALLDDLERLMGAES